MKVSVKEITETAMLIALAIVLDVPLLKIKIGTNGGSISLTMIPLFILALRIGPLKSFISIGIIYGLLACLLDGEPAFSIPFDYVLGYGAISIAGVFKNKIIKEKITISGVFWMIFSIILACTTRLIASSISSVLFYEVTFIQGLIYNTLYIGPACIISLIVMIILYKPLLSVNKHYSLKSI